jgi:predicted Zn-dependent protease
MMMRRYPTLLLAAAFALTAFATGSGDAGAWPPKKKKDKQEEQEVDHLALASMMVRDGHYDRAASVLSEVDVEQEGLDLARYYMLFGLVNLELENYVDAQDQLERSAAAGQEDQMVHVFLAQARFALDDFAGTIDALDDAGEAGRDLAGTYSLRAQAFWKLENREAAYGALAEGLKRHKGNPKLQRLKVLLLVELELYQAAVEEGSAYLERTDVQAEDFTAISEALIRGGAAEKAILILESAHLRFPDNQDLLIQLARAYLQNDRPLTAARLFRQASRNDPKLILDAAELFRRGGRPVQALYLNAMVTDQQAKIRQRLGLLIELERFEEATMLESRLSRLGLLAEEAVAYALAYAMVQIGKYDRAEHYLKQIRDPELFRKATELRRVMERCIAAGWECE